MRYIIFIAGMFFALTLSLPTAAEAQSVCGYCNVNPEGTGYACTDDFDSFLCEGTAPGGTYCVECRPDPEFAGQQLFGPDGRSAEYGGSGQLSLSSGNVMELLGLTTLTVEAACNGVVIARQYAEDHAQMLRASSSVVAL